MWNIVQVQNARSDGQYTNFGCVCPVTLALEIWARVKDKLDLNDTSHNCWPRPMGSPRSNLHTDKIHVRVRSYIFTGEFYSDHTSNFYCPRSKVDLDPGLYLQYQGHCTHNQNPCPGFNFSQVNWFWLTLLLSMTNGWPKVISSRSRSYYLYCQIVFWWHVLLLFSPRNALQRGYSNAAVVPPVSPCVRASVSATSCLILVNAIATKLLCTSSSNLADMLTMTRRWTLLILEVRSQGYNWHI